MLQLSFENFGLKVSKQQKVQWRPRSGTPCSGAPRRAPPAVAPRAVALSTKKVITPSVRIVGFSPLQTGRASYHARRAPTEVKFGCVGDTEIVVFPRMGVCRL